VIAEDEPLDENYLKAVCGVDYTFPGSWYVNAQYISRGCPTTTRPMAVDNYAFGGVDKPFFHDTIKHACSRRCVSTTRVGALSAGVFLSVGFGGTARGVFLVFGVVDTKFGAFGDDLAFLRAKCRSDPSAKRKRKALLFLFFYVSITLQMSESC
jgi:hypothetical protein